MILRVMLKLHRLVEELYERRFKNSFSRLAEP